MFIRQQEIIKFYGISASTLHRYVKDGKLTEYRTPGKHRRYDRAEIEKLLLVVNDNGK